VGFSLSKKHSLFLLLVLQAIVCILSITFFNGTGDAGDSIYHYLFAKYAPQHPELYFDHWAKPVFVLLASPFAQFGFTGMKIFNCLVSILTTYFTFKCAEELNLKNTLLIPVLMFFATFNYIILFSGFTEPLFALFTILGIYFCLKEKNTAAAIIISFLPYVRSEGLIIIGVFGLFYLYKRNFRILPLLLTGSLVYALAGFPFYHDLLWVYTKIPYAHMSSVYGSGPITHFAEQLIYVVGIPIYFLFWVGFFQLAVNSFRKKEKAEEVVLLLFAFSAYFVAHSLFWYLGIFNSYGLKRVLIGVMPIIALIGLRGFNLLTEQLVKTENAKRILKIVLVTYIIIFPFTPNPAAIQWEKDMMLGKDLQVAEKAADFFKKQGPIDLPIIYNHHFLSMAFHLDPWDPSIHKTISKENIAAMQRGQILIWENTYAAFETDVKKEELDQMPELEKQFEYKVDWDGPELVFAGYRRK
jgi:hypothetical protein